RHGDQTLLHRHRRQHPLPVVRPQRQGDAVDPGPRYRRGGGRGGADGGRVGGGGGRHAGKGAPWKGPAAAGRPRLKQVGQDRAVGRAGGGGKGVVVGGAGLVGGVLGTGFDGVGGPTASWIDEGQLRKGATPPAPGARWANFGGEERVWFGPEGGRFGLFFPPG